MKGKMKLSKNQGIKLILAAIFLIFILYFGFKALFTYAIEEDFVKFIIPISLAMAGFSSVSFQKIDSKNPDVKKEFQTFAIVMVFSSIFGLFFLFYPTQLYFGKLSGGVFFWGIIYFLAILIEERFVR